MARILSMIFGIIQLARTAVQCKAAHFLAVAPTPWHAPIMACAAHNHFAPGNVSLGVALTWGCAALLTAAVFTQPNRARIAVAAGQFRVVSLERGGGVDRVREARDQLRLSAGQFDERRPRRL